VTVTAVLGVSVLGAALIALWIVARFPEAGPARLTASAGVFGLSLVLSSMLGPAASPVSAVLGPTGVLCLLVLPYLTLLFWAAARVLRALVSLLPPTVR
jgi:hypothetical protein